MMNKQLDILPPPPRQQQLPTSKLDRLDTLLILFLQATIPVIYEQDNISPSSIVSFYNSLKLRYAKELERAHLKDLGVIFDKKRIDNLEKSRLVADSTMVLGLLTSLLTPVFGTHIRHWGEWVAEISHTVMGILNLSAVALEYRHMSATELLKLRFEEMMLQPKKRMTLAYYHAFIDTLVQASIIHHIEPRDHPKTMTFMAELFVNHLYHLELNPAGLYHTPSSSNSTLSARLISGSSCTLNTLFIDSPIELWGKDTLYVNTSNQAPLPVGRRVLFDNNIANTDHPVLMNIKNPQSRQACQAALARCTEQSHLVLTERFETINTTKLPWNTIKSQEIIAAITVQHSPSALQRLFRHCFPEDENALCGNLKQMIVQSKSNVQFWCHYSYQGTHLLKAMIEQLHYLLETKKYTDYDPEYEIIQSIVSHPLYLKWFSDKTRREQLIKKRLDKNIDFHVGQAEGIFYWMTSCQREYDSPDTLHSQEQPQISPRVLLLEAQQAEPPTSQLTESRASHHSNEWVEIDESTQPTEGNAISHSERNQYVSLNRSEHSSSDHATAPDQLSDQVILNMTKSLFYRSCTLHKAREYDPMLRWLINGMLGLPHIQLQIEPRKTLSAKNAHALLRDQCYRLLSHLFLDSLRKMLPVWHNYATAFRWFSPDGFEKSYLSIYHLILDQFSQETVRLTMILSIFMAKHGKVIDLNADCKNILMAAESLFSDHWSVNQQAMLQDADHIIPRDHSQTDVKLAAIAQKKLELADNIDTRLEEHPVLTYLSPLQLLPDVQARLKECTEDLESKAKPYFFPDADIHYYEALIKRSNRASTQIARKLMPERNPMHPAHFLTSLTNPACRLEDLPIPRFFALECYDAVVKQKQLNPLFCEPPIAETRLFINEILFRQCQILQCHDMCPNVNLSIAILCSQYNITMIREFIEKSAASLPIDIDSIQLNHFNLSFRHYSMFHQNQANGVKTIEGLDMLQNELLYALDGIRQVQATCTETFEVAAWQTFQELQAPRTGSFTRLKIDQIKQQHEALCGVCDKAIAGDLFMFFQKLGREKPYSLNDVKDSIGLQGVNLLSKSLTELENTIRGDKNYRSLTKGITFIKKHYIKILEKNYTSKQLEKLTLSELNVWVRQILGVPENSN